MNILLTSVGRRPYLVRWFQEALSANGLRGKVIAADSDLLAPVRYFADEFLEAPAVADSRYKSWLSTTLKQQNIELAVSINDYELSEWALLDESPEWDALVRLTPEVQTLVEDKLAMSTHFEGSGVPTPVTWNGSSALEKINEDRNFIVKGRFGSASKGLRFTDRLGLPKAIDSSAKEVTTRQGVLASVQKDIPLGELVIVQEQIFGSEYGLDIVCDLDGKYAAVFVRRKIAMRAGETDRAESVDPSAFEEIARDIADAVPHPGTIDVDIIIDSQGKLFVIDVNPRFGGGYPFSHLSGARVPHAYIAWTAGLPVDSDWLRYESGVVSGKYVETVRIQ